jgi:hypothetical protein
MNSKTITFSGINTKYQVKKVIGGVIEVNKTRAKWIETNKPIDSETQLESIEDLSGNGIYANEITSKLTGYKNQDILKHRYDQPHFITFQQTIELLINCRLTCFYCRGFTPILYKNVRDGNQWSLDRTNNDLGHSHSNVVISCLKCNLQRKRMSSTAFAMSKQMTITRIE